MIRVRFSPAPTGSLHIGSARTALFNWLYARHHDGVFVLRIEDTDVARSRDEWVVGIQETLRWLGIDWDEGPILQSSRFPSYLAAADRLLAQGDAYECYCTEEEVRERNDAAVAAGRAPGYDGRCRALTLDERVALAAEGRPRTIRFRTPDDGVSSFTDLIRGEVRVDWSLIHDFVIVRSDGTPIFFLANAVDDLEMGITHVIRGEDLIDSTHRVLALRAALGATDVPEYAHLPLIVDAESRAKLSKRHGAVALEDFRHDGYLPEALMNYIALLGWAPADDGDEVLDADALVAAFDLDRVTHAAAGFDRAKLDWLNGEWIRRLPSEELTARVEPLARARFGDAYDAAVVDAAVGIAQERAVTLVQIVDQMGFLFVDEADFRIAPESWEVVERTDRIGEVLDAVITHVEECDWAVDAVDFRGALTALGLSKKEIRTAMPALYAVVEGLPRGLPLFDSMHLLGRDRTLARLRAARARLTGA
jgi:glutamyl-tRNA synthetase